MVARDLTLSGTCDQFSSYVPVVTSRWYRGLHRTNQSLPEPFCSFCENRSCVIECLITTDDCLCAGVDSRDESKRGFRPPPSCPIRGVSCSFCLPSPGTGTINSDNEPSRSTRPVGQCLPHSTEPFGKSVQNVKMSFMRVPLMVESSAVLNLNPFVPPIVSQARLTRLELPSERRGVLIPPVLIPAPDTERLACTAIGSQSLTFAPRWSKRSEGSLDSHLGAMGVSGFIMSFQSGWAVLLLGWGWFRLVPPTGEYIEVTSSRAT